MNQEEKRSLDRSALATPDEVAAYLHTTKARLAQMRHGKTGPKYIRMGRRILYRWSDIKDYLNSHTVDPRKVE